MATAMAKGYAHSAHERLDPDSRSAEAKALPTREASASPLRVPEKGIGYPGSLWACPGGETGLPFEWALAERQIRNGLPVGSRPGADARRSGMTALGRQETRASRQSDPRTGREQWESVSPSRTGFGQAASAVHAAWLSDSRKSGIHSGQHRIGNASIQRPPTVTGIPPLVWARQRNRVPLSLASACESPLKAINREALAVGFLAPLANRKRHRLCLHALLEQLTIRLTARALAAGEPIPPRPKR